MGIENLATSFVRETTRTTFKSFRSMEMEDAQTSLEESTDGYAIFPQLSAASAESVVEEDVSDILRAMEAMNAEADKLPDWPDWFLEIETKKGQNVLVLETSRDEIKLLVVDGQLCFAAFRQGVPFLDLTLKKEDPTLVTRLVDAFTTRRKMYGDGLSMAVLDAGDLELSRVERNTIRRQLVRVLMRAAEDGAVARWVSATDVHTANPLRFSVLELIVAERPLIPLDGAAAAFFHGTDVGTKWLFRRARRVGLTQWISSSPMPTVERAREVADSLCALMCGNETIAPGKSVMWSSDACTSFVVVADADYLAVSIHDVTQGGRTLAAAVRALSEN